MKAAPTLRTLLLLVCFLQCAFSSAIAQSVTVSPATLSFGNQAQGTLSAVQKVTLKNGQSSAVAITSIISNLSDYTQTNDCPMSPATLGANKTCAITVTFTPASLGLRTGTLTVTDTGTNNPQKVSVTGTGDVAVTVSPSSLSFGNQPIGLKSAASELTVTNNQSKTLRIDKISTDLADYTTTSTCPSSSNTLAAGASCTVSVFFTPSVSGTRSGTVTISDNANVSPTASLTGTGIVPAVASPPILTFASQALGTTSAAQTVTLANNQSTVMTINRATSSLSDFAFTSTCPLSPATLAPGASCTASVTFSPKATGTRSGTLSFVDNANNGPQTSSLIGTGAAATLVSMAVTPATGSLPVGNTGQLTATGTYTDGSKKTLTTSVTWASSVASIATVSSAGLATALARGTTTISATSGSIQGSTSLKVTASALVSIAVTPTNASIPAGTSERFTATGTYTDNSSKNITSSVSWSSSAPTIASINTTGLATSTSSGSATITAMLGPIAGSAPLTVGPPILNSIAVTPNSPSIPAGTNLQFKAAGTYTNGSTQDVTNSVSWGSSAPGVASVSSTGLALGAGIGNSTIVASLNSVSGSALLSVAQPVLVSIAVTPINPSFALGTAQPLKATGTYTDGSTQDLTSTATWNTANPAVAAVDNQGNATGVAVGTTSVTAASGSISGATTLTVTPTPLVSIAITPAIPSISLGTTEQFTATGTFGDGSTQDVTQSVQWSSDTSSVATISNAAGTVGLATSTGTGSATITAASGSVSANTTLTVTGAVLASIAVAPADPFIALGSAQSFTATGTFTDGSTQDLTATAAWSSDTPSVAGINNAGLCTSVGVGTANISATYGTLVGSTMLTVSAAQLVSIAINQQTVSIPLGVTQQFTAAGTFSDGTTQDVTQLGHWSSTNASVATISNSPPQAGLATTLGPGTTTIQISSGTVNASAALTVNPAMLVSIQISPQIPVISLGSGQQFTATGTYTDGTTQDVTTIVNWTSSSSAVIVISNATGTNGLASSAGQGTATITASSGSLSSATTATVGPPSLASITVTPVAATLALGYTAQFTATATFTDGSTQDITPSAVWTSLVPTAGAISSTGLATSLTVGTTTISASSGSVTGSTTLTISPAVPLSLSITPTGPSIYVGGQQQFAATLQYSDGSSLNVTTSVTWTSMAGVASIASNGLASGAGAGSTTIAAIWGTNLLTSTTTLMVMLPAVEITPVTTSIPLSGTLQFNATITGSNNQTVSWSVDGIAGGNTSVGTISSSGLYTSPLMIGSHTITATAQADQSSIANATVAVGTLIPVADTFFGMHLNLLSSPIPSAMEGTARVWDSNLAQWPLLNTADNTFDWTNLDNLLAAYQAAGINDIFYTLWRVPQWASSNPSDTACDYAKQGAGFGGECDLPTDLNADGTGEDLIWRNWVQSIAQHVNDPTYLQTHAKISYWEPCNECFRSPILDPGYGSGSGVAYRGTYPQLVRMMQDARCIIVGNPNDPITALNTTCGQAGYPVIGVDPTAQMVMPSAAPGEEGKSTPYPAVMQNLLYCTCSGDSCSGSTVGCSTGSAGSAAIDIVSVHLYPTAFTPEEIPNQMATVRSYLNATDTAKPLWVGEGGWGQDTVSAQINKGDPDLEAAWVARFHMMVWAAGLVRTYWYEWDNTAWGTLWSPTSSTDCTTSFTSGYLCNAATAYQQVHDWLVGSTLTNCSVSGTTWNCGLSLSNGFPAQILWDTSQTCSNGICGTTQYPVSATFTQYTDLTGASYAISGSAPVGIKPILLTTQ